MSVVIREGYSGDLGGRDLHIDSMSLGGDVLPVECDRFSPAEASIAEQANESIHPGQLQASCDDKGFERVDGEEQLPSLLDSRWVNPVSWIADDQPVLDGDFETGVKYLKRLTAPAFLAVSPGGGLVGPAGFEPATDGL